MMDSIGITQLSGSERTPPCPVHLQLSDNCSVEVVAWLRVLPGKRYVAAAEYQGSKVLIKVFCGARFTRKAQQELQGIAALENAAVATPVLMASGENTEQRAAWVITEFVGSARTLSQCIVSGSEFDSDFRQGLDPVGLQIVCPEPVESVLQLLAKLHNKNLVQQDIHPDNFLFDSQTQSWLVVDAAEIKAIAGSRMHEQITDNFGLFLAQFPDHWWTVLIATYNAASSQAVSPETVVQAAVRLKLWRARDVADKSRRNCTLFQVNRSFDLFRCRWRDDSDGYVLSPEQLDDLLVSATLLKQGRSATLGLIGVVGSFNVLKRYNLKNTWHGLRRFWRATRAAHSWQAAHQLRVLGVLTPKPLFMIEERLGPFRKRGFLLTEYCEGEDLQSFVRHAGAAELDNVVAELAGLMATFRRYKIAHGDFKATNFIWNGCLNLIDLDAVKFFNSETRWRKAYNNDIDRLLKNWSPDSAIHQKLRKALIETN